MQKMLVTILAAIGMLALGAQAALAWPPSGCPAGEYGLIGAGGSLNGKPVPNVCASK
jgi:hypothetical protein